MSDETENAERDDRGRWRPGKSGHPDTQWSDDNPPPKSPGRPKKDAWLAELEGRLEDPRVRQALADKLLRTALTGGERASLRAINLIQDRVAGPLSQSLIADIKIKSGVLVAPAAMSPRDRIESVQKRNEGKVEPGSEKARARLEEGK